MSQLPHLSDPPASDTRPDYDVVVVGGGFAGGSVSTLLRRWLPDARILVVERTETFHRKVGEATVEISGFFVQRVLGLSDHLARRHLPKHGLRYWFSDRDDRRLEEMTEVGPLDLPDLPSFMLERPVLDAHLLDLARQEGAEVVRPAKAIDIDLGWPRSTVRFEAADGPRTVSTRWVVDASGRRSFIARQLDLHRKVDKHPTSAIWARWSGVADLDGCDVQGGDPRRPKMPSITAARRLATNHFCGYGWWCWMIPLAGGQTSIGLVWDKTLYDPPGATLRERYENFVRSTPGLRELVVDGDIVGDDFMALAHLPFTTERYADRGWALIADAAAFLDPFYSPGLDHAAISIYATSKLIESDLRGELSATGLDAALAEHNERFERSYDRWLEALYVGKYELFGDAELTRCAFLFDTAMYYLGVVTPVYRNMDELANPVFGVPVWQATAAFRFMQFFNRRMRKLARFRRRVGTYGQRNAGQKHYSSAFGLGRGSIPPLRTALGIWLRIEWEHWRHRRRHGRLDLSEPVRQPASA
ncbi:MAG: tryptophan 7-halogenase [Acidobacteriota bacterium]